MWKMKVRQLRTGRVWDEAINVTGDNYRSKPLPKRTPKDKVYEVAGGIIDSFNATLRQGESLRELVTVYLESNKSYEDEPLLELDRLDEGVYALTELDRLLMNIFETKDGMWKTSVSGDKEYMSKNLAILENLEQSREESAWQSN